MSGGLAWTSMRHPDPVFPMSGRLKDFYLVRANLHTDLVFTLSPPGLANPTTYTVKAGDMRAHVLEILPPLASQAAHSPFRRGQAPFTARSRVRGGPDDPLPFYSRDPMSPRYAGIRGKQPRPAREFGANDQPPMSEKAFWHERTRRADGHASSRRATGASRKSFPPERAAAPAEPPHIDVMPIALRDRQGKNLPGIDLLGMELRETAVRSLGASREGRRAPARASDAEIIQAMQAIVDDDRVLKNTYPNAVANLANANAIIVRLIDGGFDLRMLLDLKEELHYPYIRGENVAEPAGFAQAFRDYAARHAQYELQAEGSGRHAVEEPERQAELQRRRDAMVASNDDYKAYLKKKYRNVFSLDINAPLFSQMLGRIQSKLTSHINQLSADALMRELDRLNYSAGQRQSLLNNLILQKGRFDDRAIDAVPAFKQMIEDRVEERLRLLGQQEPDKVRTADQRSAQRGNLRKDVLATEAQDMHDRYLDSSEHAGLARQIKSRYSDEAWRSAIDGAIQKLEES